jgi:radical SAM superfamily enzyme YgiQ (UPF0313 family)
MKKTNKLLLINPVSRWRGGLSESTGSTFPPISLGILARLTPPDWEVKLIDENYEPYRFEDADVTAITAFTSAVARAYDIADEYRARGIPVVFGGIHASMLPDEALEHADAVVIGEAEKVWPDVIADFERGSLKKKYQGVCGDLTQTAVPDRSIFNPDYNVASIQTSRGCPMNCEFCSVTAFNGRVFRQRPADDVIEEMQEIEPSYMFIVDDNLVGYGKKSARRAVEIFKRMDELKLRKEWLCQSGLNVADDENVLYWMRRAGCRTIFLGIETDDPEELSGMGKPVNVRANYTDVFDKIHKYSMNVLGAFIFGNDGETVASIRRKFDYIVNASVDIVQVTHLTPLPGTRLFQRLKETGRLLFTNFPEDWKRYAMTDLVFQLDKMDPAVYIEEFKRGIRTVYSRKNIVRHFFRTWRRTGSLITALWAYNTNYFYRAAAYASVLARTGGR